MFTPNEIREIKFDKAVFGGYDIEDVDKAFAAISEDYTTLFKENTMLKKKLKLLADTVEDYRSVDEAMRKALITAQNMANDMVAEAEKKSSEMLANASENAKAKVSELTALIAAEEKKLAVAKAATGEFVDNILAMFAAEGEKFSALKSAVVPKMTEAEAIEQNEKKEKLGDTLDQISKSLEEKVKLEDEELKRASEVETASAQQETDEDADMKKVSDTIPFESSAPTAEEMDALEIEAEKPKRRRIEFTELKFGKDYDIKNDD